VCASFFPFHLSLAMSKVLSWQAQKFYHIQVVSASKGGLTNY